MKRVISLLIVVCLLLVASACAAPQSKEYEEEYKLEGGTKAIIILPGLLASGLYDEKTGDVLWDPIASDNVDLLEFMGVYDESHRNITVTTILEEELLDFLEVIDNVLGDTKRSIMRRIMCDENGDPVGDIKGVPFDYEGHQRYGALNSYKWWAEGLEAEYGDEYEVVVYNYNWLTDTRYAARDFAAFMEENNYTDVVLIGHSMGGIVASEYLALGANCRARIDKFIAVAVPFYGSYMASSTLESPYFYRDLIDMAFNGEIALPEAFASFADQLNLSRARDGIYKLYDEMIVPFLFNLKSVYQLLPSPELIALQADSEGQGIYENGKRIEADELYEWYLTRPLAHENYLGTREEAAESPVRAIIADWQEYRDGFYVDRPEGKVFSCDLVDTYYVAGVGAATELSVVIDGESRGGTSWIDGDGTVPLLSATRGVSLDSDHVYLVDGTLHIPMGTYWADGQKAAVLDIIGK